MKAGPVEIGILLQNRNRFCVPIYQRHYVWDKTKQWEPFWQDIRTKAIERLSGRDRRFSHFMGALVLESRAKPTVKQVPSFQVVDGQQRLTTFQLFLTAARHYAQFIGYKTAEHAIWRYVLNSDPHLMENAEIEAYKVWPTQTNRQMFIDIIASADRGELHKKYGEYWYKNTDRDQVAEYRAVPSMLGAYGYFYDRIRHSVETDDLHADLEEASEIEGHETAPLENSIPRELKLDAIWQCLLEEFKVVEIILDEGDDAQVIFETLNDRGVPLLAADLVRNNIFQRADAMGEKAEALFQQHWKCFEDPFWEVLEKQGRYKKQRIEFFLANFIACKIAGEVTISKLFSEYKAFLRPPNGHSKPRYATVESEIKDLKLYGAIYRDLIERTSKSALASFSSRLKPWDVSTVNPLVLRLWASEIMSDEDKAQALDVLLALVVRRAVCGLTSKNYNNFFLSIIAHLDQADWSLAQLRGFLMKQTSESGRFPGDQEFEQALLTRPIYQSLGPARTRALLSEIERHKRGRKQETTVLPDDLTIEHILPLSWRQHWPMKDGLVVSADDCKQAEFAVKEDETPIGQIVRRNRLRNTLGNLTLVTQPFNSGISNEAFATKREEFENQSVLMLTKDIVKASVWNEDTIEERSRLLLAHAQVIWPSVHDPNNVHVEESPRLGPLHSESHPIAHS